MIYFLVSNRTQKRQSPTCRSCPVPCCKAIEKYSRQKSWWKGRRPGWPWRNTEYSAGRNQRNDEYPNLSSNCNSKTLWHFFAYSLHSSWSICGISLSWSQLKTFLSLNAPLNNKLSTRLEYRTWNHKQTVKITWRRLTLPIIPGLRVYRRSTIDLRWPFFFYLAARGLSPKVPTPHD